MAKGASNSSKTKSLTFICLFMFMLNFHSSHGEEELQLLLSFKASIHDPLHFLSNWVTSSATATATTLCKWPGITCDNNTSHVNTVVISGKNITGEVPSSIFQLPHVSSLDLSNNQLVGEITLNYSLSSLFPLRYLNLSNNNLTGSLPRTLFSVSFSNLETLDLSNNMFSGNIPDQIALLFSLRYLDLGGNVLVGKIPNSITNITTLQYLTLASNQLVGEIPKDIGLMKNLKWIYLGYNNLSGEIPSSIGNLFSLNHLDLVYNNLTGPIPQSLGHLTQLQYLFLYQNKLTGPIPSSIYELKKLISLDLSDNSLFGEISELIAQLQRLEILHLFSNNFTGEIPKAIGSLPHLQVLQLWSNQLTGGIPEDLGKHSNLTVLDLSSNNLAGKIPENLCNSSNLYKLILFSNFLQGQIPHSLTFCQSLRRVRLQNNKLYGKLPSELTKLPQIYFLDISGNELSGRINDRKWDMPSLQMLSLANNNFSGEIPNSFGSDKLEGLDLSNNQFSGSIPSGFRNLSELVQLKLSNNELFGNIPEELCSCKKLVALDLSHNHLSGQIPVKLSDMPVLGLLDLSENQLSGEIPQNLGSVESLVQVNISYNNFHGSLPSTGAFLAINASAVTGNDLCDRDGDTSSRLPPCKTGNQNPTWLFIMLCFLSALVAFAAASFLVFFVRRRKSFSEVRRVENEDGTWELQSFDSKASRVMKMEDVLSSVKEGKVVSKGKNWVSYEGKCMGNDGDMQFVVEEISDLNSLPLSFWEEMVKVGKLGHPNIVKLIGMCRSGKRGYLLYENVEGKKLSEVVNGLSWQRRMKIAVGVAKALKFLHCHASSMVLIGEVSPESVWVDNNGVPRVKLSPLGMPFLDVKEARKRKDMTEKSEIYGLGVMLIELLTGRRSMDIEAGNGMHKTIVEWARYCYSDCHLDTWIDPVMKGGDALTYQNDVVETLNLALRCTTTDPTARPCARDVLKALESVHSNTATFC
ncbi:probably inactive leucine-rich repeat receptor-like protein kinase At2g25790 isoform X2 [Abrus precatorius]|uniref:Probably inactive leucine-rich repeat receptor-like protein kinase At2g25790 isoform X2 n=1 Tax=Abrus precatorius TaxID=3816 RepID=A0A8B8LIM9_ABRPR|nr:probably inactive leucine-rich repeat receptor-like protein kinase At2g25790 isoform X2 [Abrus precatorius]